MILLVKRYRRCPSNKVLVVYGKGEPVQQTSRSACTVAARLSGR